MVSSTFGDLQSHRMALISAIAGHGLHPVTMENDSALPGGTVVDASLAKVRDSSAYVGIVSHLYGQIPETDGNPDRLSLTELEFREARRLGRPVLIFIMGEEHPVTKAEVERDPEKIAKLEAFRREVKRAREGAPVHRVYREFNSLHEFGVAAMQAVASLRRHLDTAAAPASTARPAWSIPPLRGDEVTRFDLAARLVAMVVAPGAATVGLSTGLVGAGGFGKTTLARVVAHDPQVRTEFANGLVWVTVGADTTGPDLAALITSVARLFDPAAADMSDPHSAGATLGRALDGLRVLMVIDDVWSRTQVEPFLLGGDRTVRLFTTRQRDVLPVTTPLIEVDQMRRDEATELLCAGLPALDHQMLAEALRVTARWPVLLTMVHGAVTQAVAAGGNAERELAATIAALQEEGITALDVHDRHQRDRAVAQTIEVSLRRLRTDERERYREMAVFGEDVRIPMDVLATYWHHTAGWTAFGAKRLCARL